MIFASEHPINLGHEARTLDGVHPALCTCGRTVLSMADHWDGLQHNRPNQILLDLRDAINGLKGRVDWSFILHRFNYSVGYNRAYICLNFDRITDPEQINHAHRIIARLASIQGEL